MSGLLFEYLVTLGIFASGISLGYLLGLRGTVLLPAGFALGVLLRVVSYSLLHQTGLDIDTAAVWLALALMTIAAGILVARANRGFWLWSAVAALLSAYGPIITRGLEVRGRPHSDSLWILFMSDLMQAGGDLSILGDRTPIKRGFSLPMMLSLGPEGEFLSSFIATVFLAMIFVVFYGMRELAPKLSGRYWILVSVPVVLVLMNTPMFYRSIYYINGHTLTALGLGLAAVASVVAMRDGVLSRQNLVVIATGLSLVSFTRPEGVAISALVVAPLLAKPWLTRLQIFTIIASSLVSFGIWMWVYEGYLIYDAGLSGPVFIAIALALSWLIGWKYFSWLRRFLVPLAFGAMGLVLLAAIVRDPAGISEDIWSQVQNLFFGQGFWGVFFIALVPSLIAFGLKHMSAEYKNLLLISGLLAVGNLVAKLADGGLIGRPDLGRLGWFDSLNRMWIHLLAILLITLIVGLAQWAAKFQAARSSK